LYFVAVSVIRAIVGVVAGGPVLWLVEAPVGTLAIFFTGAFILQTVGAVYPDPDNHLQLDVSPWFAWLICGAFVTFMVGLLAEGHQEGAVALRAGAVGAAAWVGMIAILWLTMRVVRGRGA
jgi:hypothetical protein